MYYDLLRIIQIMCMITVFALLIVFVIFWAYKRKIWKDLQTKTEVNKNLDDVIQEIQNGD